MSTLGANETPKREQRLVFGEDAELYDKARPSYPDPLIDDLARLAGRDSFVVDVGCGTGKATVLLEARFERRGVGVEAHPEMAAVARSRTRWRIDVSDFESWSPQPHDPAPGLITAGQSWHWIDPAIGFHRAHQLLRPGGWLGLFWNRPAASVDQSEIAARLDLAYRTHAPDLRTRGMGINGRPFFDDVSEPPFSPPIIEGYDWIRDYTADEWTDLLATQSDHRLLEPKVRAALLSEIRHAINDAGGVYHHPYTAWLWAAQRVD